MPALQRALLILQLLESPTRPLPHRMVSGKDGERQGLRPSVQRNSSGLTKFADPALLRGSFAADVLSHWGAILDPEIRTSACYNQSEPRDHLDVFVSHNWSTPQRDKFLVLTFYLNVRPASLCTVVVVATVAALTTLGVLQTFEFTDGSESWRVGPWCQLLGMLTFLLVLFGWQELKAVGYRGPALFLDKACIHQTDDELKRKGIEHLAAFLNYSWSMLICYSDVYLKKLWTVYEVASFLMLHPGSALHIRHPIMVKFIFAGMAAVLTQNASFHLVHSPPVHRMIQLPGSAVPLGVAALWLIVFYALCSNLVYWTVVEQLKMYQSVQEFRFSESLCYAEEDRLLVKNNIVAFMKDQNRAERIASDDETIAKFEEIVHQEVPQLVAASLGRAGLPYWFTVCAFLPYLLQSFDYASASLHEGDPPAMIFYHSLVRLATALVAAPLTMAFQLSSTRRVIKSALFGRGVTIALSTLPPTFLLQAWWFSSWALAETAQKGSMVAAIGLLAAVAMLMMATCVVYRPIAYKRHCRRLGQDSV